MTEAQQSDALKKLVRFIIGLAIAGTIIALIWHYGVEIPAQMTTLEVPINYILGPPRPGHPH